MCGKAEEGLRLLCLQGGYRACSRLGIDSSASPFLKITFETASHFLTVRTRMLPAPRLRSFWRLYHCSL